jgi:hypothetical protein
MPNYTPDQFAELLIRHGAAVRQYVHEGDRECAQETHVAAAYDGRFINATFNKETGRFQSAIYQNLAATGERGDVSLSTFESTVEALKLPDLDLSKELAA